MTLEAEVSGQYGRIVSMTHFMLGNDTHSNRAQKL